MRRGRGGDDIEVLGEGSDGQGRMAKRDLNSYDYGNYKILIDSVMRMMMRIEKDINKEGQQFIKRN